ncbi:MAG: hypothetical protein KAF40_00320 [Flavihumibacter sp.]|nr:hypothetical protein [Flavihumibacter sp.]
MEKENPIEHRTVAVINLQGCRQCLVKNIARSLLADNDFKDLINQSVRMANEIKARKEN